MKTLLLCSVGILALSAISLAETKPDSGGKLGVKCGECHALPPGTGPDNGQYKPGSHSEHRMLACDRCHPTGMNSTTEEHVNGTISLRPEIEYQHGTEVPWPSVGSGSCGGRPGQPYQLTGCHERMPNDTCFWVPGKKCQPPEHP